MIAAPSEAREEVLRAVPLESNWEMASAAQALTPEASGEAPARLWITAVNAEGRLPLPIERPQ